MAVLTALVRLLEVKMLQMEEGTGVLEADVKLLQVGGAHLPLRSAHLPALDRAKGAAAVGHKRTCSLSALCWTDMKLLWVVCVSTLYHALLD